MQDSVCTVLLRLIACTLETSETFDAREWAHQAPVTQRTLLRRNATRITRDATSLDSIFSRSNHRHASSPIFHVTPYASRRPGTSTKHAVSALPCLVSNKCLDQTDSVLLYTCTRPEAYRHDARWTIPQHNDGRDSVGGVYLLV